MGTVNENFSTLAVATGCTAQHNIRDDLSESRYSRRTPISIPSLCLGLENTDSKATRSNLASCCPDYKILNSIDVWIIAANSMGYIQNLIQVAVLLSTDRVKISRGSWGS